VLLASEAVAQNPAIETKYGDVEGEFNIDETIRIFLGIPFAAPPVGDLRWKAPRDPNPGTGFLNCMTFGASPRQPLPEPFHCWSEEFIAMPKPLDEDCLYRNIWSHLKRERKNYPCLYGSMEAD
jgi:para-nitrobenzyl esterase